MRAKSRTTVLLCIILLSVPAFITAERESFTKESVVYIIQNNLPPRWEIVEKIPEQIPRGHYRGMEYKGRKGQEVVIQGPADVNFCWIDREGISHYVPLAKESLEIWIMPPEYGQSWKRHFMLHRPNPAELIASGRAGRVYGFQTHRLVNNNEFNALLKQAIQTSWPDSPHDKRGTLSWPAWQKDLGTILKSVVNKTQ